MKSSLRLLQLEKARAQQRRPNAAKKKKKKKKRKKNQITPPPATALFGHTSLHKNIFNKQLSQGI